MHLLIKQFRNFSYNDDTNNSYQKRYLIHIQYDLDEQRAYLKHRRNSGDFRDFLRNEFYFFFRFREVLGTYWWWKKMKIITFWPTLTHLTQFTFFVTHRCVGFNFRPRTKINTSLDLWDDFEQCCWSGISIFYVFILFFFTLEILL